MKGRISLTDFIAEVKADLQKSADTDNPFFIMGDVELEVAFTLDISGSGKAKLLVVDVGAESKASQTHKVKIKLTPKIFREIGADDSSGDGGSNTVIRKGKSYLVENVAAGMPPTCG